MRVTVSACAASAAFMRPTASRHSRVSASIGTTPQENEACKTAETEEAAEVPDTCALLEELLLAEMDDISFYRALLFAMTEADLRNAFFEILTDKQNHTVALSHLYAKYFG